MFKVPLIWCPHNCRGIIGIGIAHRGRQVKDHLTALHSLN